jgi:hypothetical protein
MQAPYHNEMAQNIVVSRQDLTSGLSESGHENVRAQEIAPHAVENLTLPDCLLTIGNGGLTFKEGYFRRLIGGSFLANLTAT